MKIHIDGPWSKDVREYGAPLRVYINLGRRGFLIVALWPGHKIQVYDRKTKTYTDRWGWWSLRPPMESPQQKE
jgi:hypothetical protein